MTGAHLILPGPNVDAESVLDLIEQEHVTIACGVAHRLARSSPRA